MEIFIIILSILFCIIGLIGSFTPIIPSPLTSWVSFLILKLSGVIYISNFFIIFTFLISISIFLIDFLLPSIGAKKFGGSKKGIFGCTIGLILGFVFLGIIGSLFGSIIGAFIGESINKSDLKSRLSASIGAFIAFITGVFLKFSVSIVFLILLIKLIVEKIDLLP
tara:strand:+ start:1381 stop:1878 length:498 start_codon:yes stop_codon:yes gene_type:complete